MEDGIGKRSRAHCKGNLAQKKTYVIADIGFLILCKM
jgi:hypothetical protein